MPIWGNRFRLEIKRRNPSNGGNGIAKGNRATVSWAAHASKIACHRNGFEASLAKGAAERPGAAPGRRSGRNRYRGAAVHPAPRGASVVLCLRGDGFGPERRKALRGGCRSALEADDPHPRIRGPAQGARARGRAQVADPLLRPRRVRSGGAGGALRPRGPLRVLELTASQVRSAPPAR